MPNPPYLSIVISARNDDHGGDMLKRMQASLNGLFEQLEKYSIDSELILVEWNPPQDGPLLRDIVPWPKGLKYCPIRVVEVPPEIHRRYPHHDRIPLHSTASQNCGIRRARGDFILATGIDILFSDELMRRLASKDLQPDCRYRVDRCDVDPDVLAIEGLREQLKYCKGNILARHGFTPKMPGKNGFPYLHTDACGDFQLMSKENWHLLRGYREASIATSHVDSLLSYASYMAGVREVVWKEPLEIYHINHKGMFIERDKRDRSLIDPVRESRFIPSWLRGKNLSSWYYKIMGGRIRYRINGVPTLSPGQVEVLRKELLTGKRPYIFNDEQWGLGDEPLEESCEV